MTTLWSRRGEKRTLTLTSPIMKIKVIRRLKGYNCVTGDLYIDGLWFCNTLEPIDRGLLKSMTKEHIKELKVYGKTAIPIGEYKVLFEPNRISILDVPCYTGVLIHAGNTAADTKGCLLVGFRKDRNMIIRSRDALQLLKDKVGLGLHQITILSDYNS